MTDAAKIAASLSEAGKRIVIETEPGKIRRRNSVHKRAYEKLFNDGVVSSILAGGYYFFDLTPDGAAVRDLLQAEREGGQQADE